jgi:hypothetical protein
MVISLKSMYLSKQNNHAHMIYKFYQILNRFLKSRSQHKSISISWLYVINENSQGLIYTKLEALSVRLMNMHEDSC